ncbi:glycoside hydrolase family 97 protein [Pontibacter harenae]|uniref:glycoside hydrolase family 97 protein n=1 Tax=Pontibacter harenae TaxID=2894083 RepID=UPI001E585E77|nr:glycoside hydrolase family 97 protein [Pontibacter harenae]MCC9165784.1 glycoside hydrolase family 97 protein [Pontibacter harenae]
MKNLSNSLVRRVFTAHIALSLTFAYSCSPRATESSQQALSQKEYTLASPDKSITVAFELKNSKPVYAINKGGELVLEESKLGVVMADEDFSTSLTLESVSEVETVQDSYELVHGKRSKVTYNAKQQVFHLKNPKGTPMDVIFNVSDDGVAFRYYFPGEAGGRKQITQELTSYNFPESAKAWLQPMSDAKSGWSETNPSYEEPYIQESAVGTPSPIKAGWVYPALFKSGNSWVLVTEAALDGSYCATRLHPQSSGGEYAVAFPQEQEVMPGGALKPESTFPWYSPWRVVTVGSLKTIVESTLGTDVAKPAINIDKSFIKPGNATWSWALLKDDSIVYNVQKRFIDYAADMNWSYCLVDVNWDRKIGYDKIKELADYGKKKNVGLLLWYNSSGSWNSTEYSPKSALLTHEVRVKEFSRLRDMGIKGVKIDFFGGDGQSVIQYYLDILKDAADYQLLVNFHGATLPRGWQRTYPHLMTVEAVKGFEMITFEQNVADVAPAHMAMLPYTRNAFDPMDFTPLSLHEIPNIKRRTTTGYEVALPVIFLSGVQHFAETPRGMAHVPTYVKDYLRQVPAAWDETIFIDGYPGKLAIIARRTGNRWYVAGINGENQEKTVQVDLSFIGQKSGELITDGTEWNSFSKKQLNLAQGQTQQLVMKPNGGFVMVF